MVFAPGVLKAIGRGVRDRATVNIGKSRQDPAYRQIVNTNLGEVSDWLTKIIVGLGLFELKSIPQALSRIGRVLAHGATEGPIFSFALALITYFSILGFLFGYVSTRLFLSGAFSRADMESISAKREDKQAYQSSLRDLDKRIAEAKKEVAEPEKKGG